MSYNRIILADCSDLFRQASSSVSGWMNEAVEIRDRLKDSDKINLTTADMVALVSIMEKDCSAAINAKILEQGMIMISESLELIAQAIKYEDPS